MQKRLGAGELLFREGDPVDAAYRLLRGEVEILRESGSRSIVLGTVHAGEFIGEMGVIENRARRSATARAGSDAEVEIIPARDFFEQVSRSPDTARELLLRLSSRLHEIEDRVADSPQPPPADRPVPPAEISISAKHPDLRRQMGTDPIAIEKLPFIVGRKPVTGEAGPGVALDLRLEDDEPFALSRAHFMVLRGADGYAVRDLNSTLGTSVNGQAIGHHFKADMARLRSGANEVVAAGRNSPFVFTIMAP